MHEKFVPTRPCNSDGKCPLSKGTRSQYGILIVQDMMSISRCEKATPKKILDELVEWLERELERLAHAKFPCKFIIMKKKIIGPYRPTILCDLTPNLQNLENAVFK